MPALRDLDVRSPNLDPAWMSGGHSGGVAPSMLTIANTFPGGGGVPADIFAVVVALVTFAVLYVAIDLIDRI